MPFCPCIVQRRLALRVAHHDVRVAAHQIAHGFQLALSRRLVQRQAARHEEEHGLGAQVARKEAVVDRGAVVAQQAEDGRDVGLSFQGVVEQAALVNVDEIARVVEQVVVQSSDAPSTMYDMAVLLAHFASMLTLAPRSSSFLA